ncbi:hypothetical protein PEPS_37950 (plasmid) [Persicobacter psychrovividus]|uniref:Uncharacterized protein n=1 Tax=Persicobacter psychrovividus TaxID=387638 RepID=A0ABN6LEA8_9BACT|nr:hypothetical protein PEPS_37950 [Persicobacter psychrovividus]
MSLTVNKFGLFRDQQVIKVSRSSFKLISYVIKKADLIDRLPQLLNSVFFRKLP